MKTILQNIGLLMAMLLGSLSVYAYDFEVDGIYYNLDVDSRTATVTYKQGPVSNSKRDDYNGNIIIPSVVNYMGHEIPVTAIGHDAFYRAPIKSIQLPNSISVIGYSAFEYTELKSITIPPKVKRIEDHTFSGCTLLENVILHDEIEFIGSSAFSWCSGLKSIALPNSIKEIKTEAFYSCKNLSKIILPDNLKYIAKGLFYKCESLTSLIIPNQVERIDAKAFNSCCNLSELSIPGSVSVIDVSAVSSTYIKTFTFEYSPNDIDFISEGDLYRFPSSIETLNIERDINTFCTSSLRRVKTLKIGSHVNLCYLGVDKNESLEVIESACIVPPKISSNNYANVCFLKTKVLVPNESLEAYRNADVWKDFWDIEGYELPSGLDGVCDSPTQKSVIGWYDMSGRPVGEDYHGLVLVRYSDGTCEKEIKR